MLRVLERNGFLWKSLKAAQRVEIECRRRLRLSDVLGTAQDVKRREKIEPCEVTRDPRLLRA